MSESNPSATRRDFLRAAGTSVVAASLLNTFSASQSSAQPADRKTGFAVVGLGALALGEVMPAFAKSTSCRASALVSGHPDKAKKVADQYRVDPKRIYNYENFDEQLKNDLDTDVVYIILPNNMHAEYTIRALRAGKHVLCEKPMAPTIDECEKMIAASKETGKKLMIAYRLHYEPFNQRAIQIARSKQFGPIRIFESMNIQTTNPPNIRLQKSTAGGPLGDVGVYCINAMRYITGEEPNEVTGMHVHPEGDDRFKEVPGHTSFTLRFPSGVLATGLCGFDGAGAQRYRAVCADGWLQLDHAFPYQGQKLSTSKESEIKIEPVDHFAAEMDHFAECIKTDKQSATPGEEGLQDVRIITAINESAASGRAVKVGS